MKEWKATRMYSPRQEQFFSGGVTVCVDEGKTKVTEAGIVVLKARNEINICIGADNLGYVPRDKKEDELLFEMTKKNDPFGICLFADRQLPKKEKALEQNLAGERARGDAAIAALEKLKAQARKAGLNVDENGEIVS